MYFVQLYSFTSFFILTVNTAIVLLHLCIWMWSPPFFPLFPSCFFFFYYVLQMVAYTSLFLLLLNNMFLGKMFFPSLNCSMTFFSTRSEESISGIWNIHICILYIEYIQIHCFLLWTRSLSLSLDGLKNEFQYYVSKKKCQKT